jgi:two-component system, chemotaxis family, CheB/CheR fusion protein
MHVRARNRRAEDLWGLRREEAIGQHFLNLDTGLPTDQLRPLIRGVLAGDPKAKEILLSAVNRRGHTIRVRVIGTPLSGDGSDATGVILVMDAAEPGPDGPASPDPAAPVSPDPASPASRL